MKQRNKTAQGCLQILAVLVVIAFVVTAVFATMVTSLSFTFTSRAGIKSAINVDEFVRELMTEAIVQNIQQKYSKLNLPPADIDSITLRYAVDLLVPVWWVDRAVDDGIDNIFNFLEEGRTDDYLLDYNPLIEIFRSETGEEAVTTVIAHYPPCPSSEPSGFEDREYYGDIRCLPSGMSVSQVADRIHSDLISNFITNPKISASGGVERLEWPSISASEAEDIRYIFQILSWLWLFWLIPLGLLVVIAILAVRSLYSLGIWFGSPLLVTGLLAPVVSLITFVLIASFLQPSSGGLGSSKDTLEQLLALLVVDIVASLRNIWILGVCLQSGGMIILAAGGLFLALFLKRRTDNLSASQNQTVEQLDVHKF